MPASEPGRVEIRVKDTGIGIPKEYVARSLIDFSRFPKGSLDQEPVWIGHRSGNGSRHKGEIACESKLGEGTQFVLTLNATESRA